MATRMHPPPIVYAMLAVMALIGALLAGYHMAGGKARSWLHTIGFAAVISSDDLCHSRYRYPRLGLIRVDAADEMLSGPTPPHELTLVSSRRWRRLDHSPLRSTIDFPYAEVGMPLAFRLTICLSGRLWRAAKVSPSYQHSGSLVIAAWPGSPAWAQSTDVVRLANDDRDRRDL